VRERASERASERSSEREGGGGGGGRERERERQREKERAVFWHDSDLKFVCVVCGCVCVNARACVRDLCR